MSSMNPRKLVYALISVFIIVLIINYKNPLNDKAEPIDYSDPNKENLVNCNITKDMAYDILINNFPHKELVAYSINMEKLNIEIDNIKYEYVWSVQLSIINVYDRKITYMIYLDVEAGDILQVSYITIIE